MFVSNTNGITYDDYDRVSDDINPVGMNFMLRINVKLNRIHETLGKMPFHTEYAYNNKDDNTSVLVRRSFDYYLTLETIKANDLGYKESVMINQADMLPFKGLMEGALKWFTDDLYKDLYMIRDKELVMTGHPEPLIITVLALEKWIRMEPVIINKKDKVEPGVCISLNSDTTFSFMTIPNIMAIVSFLSTYNMFQSAQEMLSYHRKPPKPKIVDFRDSNDRSAYSTGNPGRFIGDNRKE